VSFLEHRLVCRARMARAAQAVVLVGLLLATGRWAQACPFCTALKPSLSQQRDAAAAVALAELVESNRASSVFLLHKLVKGPQSLHGVERLTLDVPTSLKPGALAILFGSAAADAKPGEMSWTIVGVNETSYTYFARAPSLRTPAADRLRYFAPFLEHADALVAEDAYLEFGHAPFGTIAESIETLPMDRMRLWMTDERVPPARKGFYGLALGLASGDADRSANAQLLRSLILRPENDFRAGFDGVLGGYLMLSGETGLALFEKRYLGNKDAADGDLRHTLTALRFYHEFGRAIAPARLNSALRLMLARPEFADAVITDLARWQDWSVIDRVADLYGQKDYSAPATRRAVVGYLLACPKREAAQQLARLKHDDPAGVSEAERTLSSLGGLKQ
jgi:hypothetical protein